MEKIIPCLWYDGKAAEAAEFYCKAFAEGKIIRKNELHGHVLTVEFELAGQQMVALNGGPMFRFNPSFSFYVTCESVEEVDALWAHLSNGGRELMPLDAYPWSKRFGWVEDRYGLSWQIAFGKLADVGRKLAPMFMFAGERRGQAEAAFNFYTELFPPSQIDGILKYGPEHGHHEGLVMHAQFRCGGQTFMVIDNPDDVEHPFSEAASLMLICRDQQEVDNYWERLSAGGGQPWRCCWLKDRFGIAWQVVPAAFLEWMADPAKAPGALAALMWMQKPDIETLEKGANGQAKPSLIAQGFAKTSAENAWDCWTKPEHIVHWNFAAPEWHCPRAEVDLRPGGRFSWRMEARDGSMGFDFSGEFETVQAPHLLRYRLDDNRLVQVDFYPANGGTYITEVFEPENSNPPEMQQKGWQAILDNFVRYAENEL